MSPCLQAAITSASEPLRFAVAYTPQRAMKTTCDFIIAKASGGRWRFEARPARYCPPRHRHACRTVIETHVEPSVEPSFIESVSRHRLSDVARHVINTHVELSFIELNLLASYEVASGTCLALDEGAAGGVGARLRW